MTPVITVWADLLEVLLMSVPSVDFHLPVALWPMKINLLRVSQGIPLLFYSKLARLVEEGHGGVRRTCPDCYDSLSLRRGSVPALGDGLHKHSAHLAAEQDLAGLSPHVLCCVLRQVWLFVTPWTVACQDPPGKNMVTISSFRGLPHPGIEPKSLASPALAGRFFTNSSPWEAQGL